MHYVLAWRRRLSGDGPTDGGVTAVRDWRGWRRSFLDGLKSLHLADSFRRMLPHCGAAVARRALLPPSPQLMEIISPISAGRCQNGKIMSSSRATIHYLNCLVVGILKWNFQTKKSGKGKSEGWEKRGKS